MTRLWNSLVQFCRLGLALGCFVGFAGSAGAQKPDDPFGNLSAPGKQSIGLSPAERIELRAEVAPTEVRRGQMLVLTITGKLKPGYHTYPLTMRSADPEQSISQLSTLHIEGPPGIRPLFPIRESDGQFEHIEGVGTFLEHKERFTWTQDILVLPEASPGVKTLKLHVRLQVCDTSCVWKEEDLDVGLTVQAGPAISVDPAIADRLSMAAPGIKVVPLPGSGTPAAPDDKQSLSSKAGNAGSSNLGPAGQGLGAFLAASVGAAVLMLFTPCVFPMIPITVSFFLKQSERKDHNPLASAGVYSITIIVVLAIAVMLMGQLIINLANSAWVNLGLGVLLVFFALSLFGMYEIELPAGLARFTAAREGQGGYAGVMFMALTFTITSFTCTGPFLGPLLVAVKESPMSFVERSLGALCYAATFAAPFFVLALFPSLLKKLPKSGGWLNAVKVVMGFLELAAALKFLANTDLAWNPGTPVLFTYETVLCAWIALAVCCGLYLFGAYRLPHDTPLDHLGVGRMLLAASFLALAVYMTPALWRVTPQGVIGRGLVAFLPLDTRPSAGDLAWLQDYQRAWEEANRDGKLIFIDFTGQNCTNCRYNEKNVFPLPAVRQALEPFVRVRLYTDFVPDDALSARASQEQGQRNSDLQSATVGDVSNPLYAVIRPDRDQPFADAGQGKKRIKGSVLDVRKGLISRGQVPDFEAFLRQAQVQTNPGERSARANDTSSAP